MSDKHNEHLGLDDIDVNAHVEGVCNIFDISEFFTEATERRTNGNNHGAFIPFWDEYGEKFVLRPRELSIFFGSRGSYKSTVVTYLMVQWILSDNGKCGYLSYEEENDDIINTMIGMLANSTEFTEEFARKAEGVLADRCLVNCELSEAPDAAIAKIKSLLDSGCKLIALDCLQRVNMPTNNVDLERQFVIEVSNLARNYEAHIIIVHHSRKMAHSDGDNPRATIDDLKGSGGLADNAHNVVAIFSNKKKKDLQYKVNSGYQATEEELELLDFPDVELAIKKQRKHFYEGVIGLWRTDARAFHLRSRNPRVL